MSFLALQHADAVLFYVVLVAFELVRRRAGATLRHPLAASLARGALVAAYFAAIGVDPARWLSTNVEVGVAAGVALAAGVAVTRRADVVALAHAMPAMVVQAAYLAIAVAAVEELVFRGAFVLVAAVTPAATVLASAGSSIAYVVWRVPAWRDREPRSLARAFAAAFALGVVAGLTRSLWPGLVAHAAYAILAGPPRTAPARTAPAPHPRGR